MVLHVALVGKCNRSPPTRVDLLKRLRRTSPRSYHATRSYLWTEESLFERLAPVSLDAANSGGSFYYAFGADLSCGNNDDDVRVTIMMMLDLTAAVNDMVAILTEREGGAAGANVEEADSNVVLVELADVVEQSEESRSAYLTRWGAEEHNYHRTMAHRVLLSAGKVYVVPLPARHSCRLQQDAQLQEREKSIPFAFLAMDGAAREELHDPAATRALHEWSNGVARVMREESWHFAVAAVPASVGELVHTYPQILQPALLHHSVREPLHWLRDGKLAPMTSDCTEGIIRGVIQEYCVQVQNGRYVRLPLRMPRHTFAHFYCAGLSAPSTVAAAAAEEALARARASLAGNRGADMEADSAEVFLGLQLTIALHRLRSEVSGPHSTAIDSFLKERQCRNEESTAICLTDDISSQNELGDLRRKVMSVASRRGDSIEWMRAYAQEAAVAYNMTDNEVLRLDESMLGLGETDTLSTESNNYDSDDDDDDDGSATSAGDDSTVASRHVEEMESLLEAGMCEAVLGSSHDDEAEEEAALEKVADNILFLETVQMLARDGMSRK
ncbi:hypothetical protein DQ04_03171020 [Trypanosoma grayi]|uniref:hypothetical protein n=1 Tax=Trypanosoma grayi TaxID=71804 RepID=UPI0004F4A73C|nr:hypothetical protein DQ04_03171020 [Trypanosoma grayi]KEG10898.1 hypothetical protein DQ04_03171020 [Trypanosoma grayi]